MKKRLLICILALLGIAAAVYNTVAYFTSEDTAANVITAGNIKIQLVELSVPEDGGEPVPFENIIGIMPGGEVSKIVQVKNIGDQPAYIRIAVEKKISLAEGVQGNADVSLISCNFNTVNWTEQEGYFYYNVPLAAGETTEPLFTRVSFARDMGNLYQNSGAEIRIHAYAVQAANNGSSALEAAGWSER